MLIGCEFGYYRTLGISIHPSIHTHTHTYTHTHTHTHTHVYIHTYIQNQVGGSDCGLFAIAFAVSICLGMNPSKFIYDQENMRRHLIECIENQKFSNFPFSVNTNWKKKKVTKKRERIYTAFVAVSMIVKWYNASSAKCFITAVWLYVR